MEHIGSAIIYATRMSSRGLAFPTSLPRWSEHLGDVESLEPSADKDLWSVIPATGMSILQGSINVFTVHGNGVKGKFDANGTTFEVKGS